MGNRWRSGGKVVDRRREMEKRWREKNRWSSGEEVKRKTGGVEEQRWRKDEVNRCVLWSSFVWW